MPTETTAPRLIDANALLEEVKALNKKNPDFSNAPWNTIDDAIFLINSAPTVETTDDVLARLPEMTSVGKTKSGKRFAAIMFDEEGIILDDMGFVADSPLEAVTRLEASLNSK